MHLSVVTPVYQAGAFIEDFHARMSQAARSITSDYEIIYVNDGSRDDSLAKLLAIHERDAHAVIVDLTRNFGQANAIRTGLSYASGEQVFIIDDDLEEQPEWLPTLSETLREKDLEVVFCAQRKRKGSLLERYWGALFFLFMQYMLRGHPISNVMTARLMTRPHVQRLLHLKERNASFTALSLWVGCKHAVLYFDKLSHRNSSYTMKKRWRLMINHITSASLHPLYWPLILAGAWLALFGVLLVVSLLGKVSLLLWQVYMQGIGFAFCLISTAVLGVYMGQLYDEMRGRPLSFVRAVYKKG